MTFNKNTPYNNLPALPPAIDAENTEILKLLVAASRHLGELNGVCSSIADPTILINTIILEEGKNSSELEHITTTHDELFEAITGDGSVGIGTMEVLNYTEALYSGMGEMIKRKHVISLSTLTGIAQVIKGNDAVIRTGRGIPMINPVTGEVAQTPPEGSNIIRDKLADLERFINDNNYCTLDPLIKMAMIHYQFAAIQPLTVGNGRTGRILNELYLVQQGLLPMPVLGMSAGLAKNKVLYNHLLAGVAENDNWQEWIKYNLTIIAETARQTTNKIRQLVSLKKQMEGELKKALGSSYTPKLLQLMFESPYLKIELLDKRGLSHRQTASVWLKKLVGAGVLSEQKKGKTLYFIDKRLMNILAG